MAAIGTETLRQGAMPNMWITEQLTKVEDVEVHYIQFIAELNKFEGPDQSEMWVERKRAANDPADTLRKKARIIIHNGGYIFAYKPSGKVAGLMSWWRSTDGSGKALGLVETLAMLPERESEGAILIEHAVNLSEKAGFGGYTLFMSTPYVPDYQQEWRQWLRGGSRIAPGESDEWVKLDGKWRLQKYLQMQVNGPLVRWRHVVIGRQITGKIGPIPRLPGQPKPRW